MAEKCFFGYKIQTAKLFHRSLKQQNNQCKFNLTVLHFPGT